MFKLSTLSLATNDVPGGDLETVRLGSDSVLVIPFSDDADQVTVHYLNHTGINGYVRCNVARENECVACDAGCHTSQRILMPVYNPVNRRVEVLAMSDTATPRALLPQVMSALASGRRSVWHIRKPTATTFELVPVALVPGVDDGATPVKAFLEKLEGGQVDIKDAVRTVSNDELREVPELRIKLDYSQFLSLS